MIVIIPDTNVIVAASIKTYYEGTEYKLNTQHKFHDESSQLFDIIKDEKYPNVKSILLEKVKTECASALPKAVRDTCENAVVEDAVKKAVKKISKKLRKNIEKNEKEIKVLKDVYSEIPNTIKGLRKKQINEEMTDLEKAVEITSIKTMDSVVRDPRHVDLDPSKFVDLWNGFYKEATKLKNNDLNKLCERNVAKIIHDCEAVMSLFVDRKPPNLDYNKVCSNLELVNECFEELIAKNKDSKQVVAHIKSEKGGHSHKPDKRILAQAATYKRLVDDPESKDHIPNCEIYIASNDRKFFSPHRGDSTITDAIYDEFKIICDSPKEIVGIVKKSKDNA